jgi:hypothetical protein
MAMRTMSRLAKVVLDRSQEITAHRVGLERTIVRNANPSDASNYGQVYKNWHELVWQEAESAAAEIAVASHFGDFGFIPKIDNAHDTADVGDNIEVKWTKHANGHLILQNRGPGRPTDVAILVTGWSPVYTLLGWMPVHMAKQARYKHPHQNNYWVPRSSLFEMQYLKRSNYGDV